MFEGIPNFEDLVVDRPGDWFVVLESWPQAAGRPAPTIMEVDDAQAAATQQRVWNEGRVPFAVPTEELPAFAPGLVVLVLGPFERADAEREWAAIRPVVPDAYLKAGW